MSSFSACSCSWPRGWSSSRCSTPSSGGSKSGDLTRVEPIMTDAADGRRNGMSSAAPMRAASAELQMPAILRWYLVHERVILGTLVVMVFLIGWEGLESGWWADMLRPLLGASAGRLQL